MTESEAAPPRLDRVDIGGGLHIAIAEWGAADASEVVVCVHGLTRNARDFDWLATELARRAGRRVISIDVVGRGRSDRLPDPTAYGYPTYHMHMLALLDALKLATVDWIGTSMGGLIGMGLAAQAPARIRRLVLNDIGPMIPRQALKGIVSTSGSMPRLADEAEAEAYFRQRMASFGPLTDAQWRHVVLHGTRRLEDGALTPGYDPAISSALTGADAKDIALWPLWEAIKQPRLLIRGGDSEVLLRATALGMVASGPVDLVEFPGIGHAPSLMARDQIAAIADWLNQPHESKPKFSELS